MADLLHLLDKPEGWTSHDVIARMRRVLGERLRGLTLQRPPLYSAVKVRGERLYKAARRGETLEAEERPIRVYDIRADLSALPDVTLDLTVSRGTYVRTLAHDLGEGLGCGA